MDSLVKDEGYNISNWQERQSDYSADWLSRRLEILNLMLKLQVPPEEDIRCDGCGDGEAIVRCFDCIGSHLCYSCDSLVHRCNPTHDRYQWTNGFMEILPQGNVRLLHVYKQYMHSVCLKTVSAMSLYSTYSKATGDQNL